jgi:hypothetical protein
MAPETQEEKRGPEDAGELLLGLVITAFALFVIVESLRMPQRGHLGVLMSPGFVPLFTGIVLLFLSIFLNLRAIRSGAHRKLRQWPREIFEQEENRRFVFILGFMVLYVVVLLGRIHYIAATLIFHVLIFIYLKVGGPLKILLWTLVATFLVSFLLPKAFEMPVP